MAGCSAVAFGLLGAALGHPAYGQSPPVKGAVKGVADPKAIFTPPAKPPATKDAAEIESLRRQLSEATNRANEAEARAINAEKRASDAARQAGDAGKRGSDAVKRADEAEKRAREMAKRAGDAVKRADEAERLAVDAEKLAGDAGKRASDAEGEAAAAAKALADANHLAEGLRKKQEEAASTGTALQRALDEARADLRKRADNDSRLNAQIERLNIRIGTLETAAKAREMELLLFPAVAVLLGGGLGFVLGRVFPKPQRRISVPPGATVRAHVVLNVAQSETRIEGASPAGPSVRVAASIGPGITQLIFLPQEGSP
jgi:hypothetical protein